MPLPAPASFNGASQVGRFFSCGKIFASSFDRREVGAFIGIT